VPEGIPKWSTASGTKKSEMLWNFERVLENQNWCVLVEGVFDALRMKDWAVAMLGKAPSDTQKALLEYFQHIFIMLDSDATDAAYEAARDLVDDAAFRVTVVPLEKGDPDDHEFEELGRLVQAAAPRKIAADLEVFCR
jgi:DNA primase